VRKTIGIALLISGMVAMLGLTAGPSLAASGSNGDVKVSNTSVDDIPNNDPHQSCLFNLEFYNFDLGSPDATYTLSLVSPTGSGVLKSGTVAVGNGPMAGYNQLDAVKNVDLTGAAGFSGVTPASQGFHVSLDVTDAGLQGGAKSKTFWVSGDCGGGGTLPG